MSVDLPATPHRPKPELRRTEPLRTSATASSAVPRTLESLRADDDDGCERRIVVVRKVRRAAIAGPAVLTPGATDSRTATRHTSAGRIEGLMVRALRCIACLSLCGLSPDALKVPRESQWQAD